MEFKAQVAGRFADEEVALEVHGYGVELGAITFAKFAYVDLTPDQAERLAHELLKAALVARINAGEFTAPTAAAPGGTP